MISNLRRAPFIFIPACRTAFTENIIDKHDSVAHKTMVPDRHQFTDKTVRLDPGFLTDHHTFLDFSIGSYKAFISDAAAIKVYWLHNLHIYSELNIRDPGF